MFEVSLDPAVRWLVQVPLPYRLERAQAIVEDLALTGWDRGRRAKFLVEEAATGRRLARVGLGLPTSGVSEVGYWVDPVARGRSVATAAVRAACG